MKKIFAVICGAALLLAGCFGGSDLPAPDSMRSGIPGNLNMSQIESGIRKGCMNARWRVTDNEPGFMAINIDTKGMVLDATITYNQRNYTINFDRVVSSTSSLKKTYAYYKKLIVKLDKTIQRDLQRIQ